MQLVLRVILLLDATDQLPDHRPLVARRDQHSQLVLRFRRAPAAAAQLVQQPHSQIDHLVKIHHKKDHANHKIDAIYDRSHLVTPSLVLID